MKPRPRLAVRGLIMRDDRLLLVNAWPNGESDLMCAPGGGVEPGQSLPENLKREVYEETGLDVTVGVPVMVNEFHDPKGTFHQVDIYFRCNLIGGDPDANWIDIEGVVTEQRWVTRSELGTLRVKPDSLGDVAWGADVGPAYYDPLEPTLR